jgi:hypothetical protein
LIALLDADDQLHPDKVRVQVAAFQNDPEVVLCHTNFSVIDEANQLSSLGRSSRSKPAQGNVSLDLLLGRCFVHFGPMFRRDAFDAVGGIDERYSFQDWPLYLKLARIGTFSYCGEPLMLRRVHTSNMNNLRASASRFSPEDAAISLLRELSPTNEVFEEAAAVHISNWLLMAIAEGNYVKAWAILSSLWNEFPEYRPYFAKQTCVGLMGRYWNRFLRGWMPHPAIDLAITFRERFLSPSASSQHD